MFTLVERVPIHVAFFLDCGHPMEYGSRQIQFTT